MDTQLHVAYRLVDHRAHSAQDRVLVREAQLARSEARRARRAMRRAQR